MLGREKPHVKPVSNREWYDFVGQLAELIPDIHPGGEQATRTLLGMCDLDGSSTVLDVGCGSGSTASLIVERYGARVLGVDASKVMVGKAVERSRKRGCEAQTDFLVADVTRLGLKDDSFDLAIIQSVLVPLAGDQLAAMKETVRVVRPGGRVAANEGTLDPSAPAEFHDLLRRHPAISGHVTPGALRNLFEDAGLEVLEMQDFAAPQAAVAKPSMSLSGLFRFLIQVYPAMLLKLLRSPRLREASRVDNQVNKLSKQFTGYSLIVGQKPMPA